MLQAIVLLVGACLVTLLALAAIDFDWSRVAGLLKLPVLFIMVIPGVIATLILPPLDNGDQVFPP